MDEKLHVALINTLSAHKKRGRQEFQALNLSDGQPKVLCHLYENDGMVQKELARVCQVEPATMTALLRRLTDDGLVRKETVYISGGKRAFGIFLTESGRNCAEKVNEIVDALEDISFKGFTALEKNNLYHMLQRITDNLL